MLLHAHMHRHAHKHTQTFHLVSSHSLHTHSAKTSFYPCCCCVQLLGHVPLFGTPWTAAHQASLSFTISQSLLKLMSTESVMPSHHLVLCRPLLLLPSAFPSSRVFSKELALHIRWPKYWSFSFSISFPKEYSGLISFRIDWFDLLAAQEYSPTPQFKSISSSAFAYLGSLYH